MKRFYCTIYDQDIQVADVFTTEKEAREKVVNHLIKYRRREFYNCPDVDMWADLHEWSSKTIGYGIIEIEAEDEDEVWEKDITYWGD